MKLRNSFVIAAVLLIGLLCMSCGKQSICTEIIPHPVFVKSGFGSFTFTPHTSIFVNDQEQAEVADWFVWLFARPAGFVPHIVKDKGKADIIFVSDCEMKRESYRLKVTPRSVEITASGAPGFFYALQTLRYSLPEAIHSSSYVPGVKWSVPSMTVQDTPRFAHRCLRVDMSDMDIYRNRLYDLLDNMALLKFNVLHLNMVEGCSLAEQELEDLSEYAASLQIKVNTGPSALPRSMAEDGKGASDSLIGFANRSLKDIYFYEPGIQEDFHSFLMGLFSSSWLDSCTDRDDLMSKLLPRIAALSEISWSPQECRDWMRFSKSAESYCSRMNLAL